MNINDTIGLIASDSTRMQYAHNYIMFTSKGYSYGKARWMLFSDSIKYGDSEASDAKDSVTPYGFAPLDLTFEREIIGCYVRCFIDYDDKLNEWRRNWSKDFFKRNIALFQYISDEYIEACVNEERLRSS